MPGTFTDKMTAFESTMAQHPYTSDSSFEDFSGLNAYKPTSPHTGFSPSIGNQEFSALLDAFTNAKGEEHGSSLFAPSNLQSQSSPYFQSSSYDSFNPAWTMSSDSQPSSFGQSTDSSYSPRSNIMSATSQGDAGAIESFNTGFTQQNINPFDTAGAYSPAEGYVSTHVANSSTVPFLEAIAAAPSSAMSTTKVQSQMHAQPEHTAFDPRSSHLSRQDSTRSFLEGPHLSNLTLESPRNSVSAGSSTPSSSQNSPTTPLSAYSTDTNLSFQAQQQKHFAQNQTNQVQQQSAFIPYANSTYQVRSHYGNGNPLSMSVPASMSRSGYEQPVHSQLQASARPHGRMSSAGLLDQIVSSRQVLVSPNPEQPGNVSQATSLNMDSKKGVRSRASSRSKKTSPTPPLTPGRSSLRSSKHGIDPGQLETILSGHTTPTGEATGARQTPSSAGPHRTPSKRALSYEDAAPQAITPATTNTLRRPSTLRRTASHTPGATFDRSASFDGLASPANLQASQRAQNAAHFAMASAMPPAQKARIAASANLEFPGSTSGVMSRAQSSPGYALSGAFSPQESSSQTVASPDSAYNQSKRRSNTLTALHMSPLGLSTGQSSQPSPGTSQPVSFAEALLALDQITSFLNYQSSIITPYTTQSVDSVLGTYEQMQSIEDLKKRVHNKLAFPS